MEVLTETFLPESEKSATDVSMRQVADFSEIFGVVTYVPQFSTCVCGFTASLTSRKIPAPEYHLEAVGGFSSRTASLFGCPNLKYSVRSSSNDAYP